MYDFHCQTHGDFEDQLPFDAPRPLTSTCPDCSVVSPLVWRRAPGVFGDENVPKERMAAARSGCVNAAEHYIPPFNGSTRSELAKWERTFNVVHHTGGERRSGRLEINQKVPWLKTEQGKRKHGEILAHAVEVAKAGDEAVMCEMAKIEKPNAFDVNAFSQQAGAGGVPVVAKNGIQGTDIAADLATVH